jgi:signal recognition particle GTPase
MTPDERRNHAIINGSRRRRIAKGSGTTVEEINRLLKQFTEMRKVLKMMSGGPALKNLKMPGGMVAQQALRNAGHGGGYSAPGMKKKRKKGGPWGLIKT